jgi:hypothetical protein
MGERRGPLSPIRYAAYLPSIIAGSTRSTIAMDRTLLFVCPHGAGKSRLAAAFFNAAAPAGWQAATAGHEPGEGVSPIAVRLLAGSDAGPLLDYAPPRPISAIEPPARIVAIDCDVTDAERWDLESSAFDEAMRDEIRDRVDALIRELTVG